MSYNSMNFPTHVVYNGTRLPIVRAADGHRYILDPNHILPHPHVDVPIHTRYSEPVIIPRDGDGMGMSQALQQGGIAALNFIPGVGPILSTIASLASSLFGGGDPTPEWKLTGELLQLRQQIAQAHAAMGVADDFQINGTIGNGQNEQQIKEAYNYAFGVQSGTPWSREKLYEAIKNLQGQVQGVAQQAHDAALLQEFQQMQGGADSTGSDTATSVLPWIVGGGGLVLAFLAFAHKKD